jgi:hypothetical protein
VAHEFINAWREQSWTKRPYIFDGDEEILPETKMVKRSSHDEYVMHEEFSDHHTGHFHTGLLPVPFHGYLETADIFICLTNPGLNILDYYTEGTGYRDLLLKNLKQDLRTERCPFSPLDPKWHWTAGGQWWNRLFREIIAAFREKKKVSHAEAASIISRRIAALELIPYHSTDSSHVAALAKRLKSTALAKKYLRDVVIPKAEKGDALVVIVSSYKLWDIRPGLPNVVYPPKKKGPKAHLSMKSGYAGDQILKWLLTRSSPR